MEIFNKFESDPNLKELTSNADGRSVVYRPVRLSEQQGCLNCHGHPDTSPWKNGKDILGYQMEDWKEGKLHGVFAVENDVAAILKAQGNQKQWTMAGLIFVASLVALGISALFIRRPLEVLSAVATNLVKSGEQVTGASAQIASSSQALSQAATEQAASLQETAASLEEISAMIGKASDSAGAAATGAVESQRKAEEGRVAVDQMLRSIDDISQSNQAILEQVNESNREMTAIVKVIEEIASRTKVINDIVFQTKLLSFNASVEAARAGEHGKGFAVVAEEVGNLAQMSGDAAREINQMLENSMTKVEKIVHDSKAKVEILVENGREKVESGVDLARQADALKQSVRELLYVIHGSIHGSNHGSNHGQSEGASTTAFGATVVASGGGQQDQRAEDAEFKGF